MTSPRALRGPPNGSAVRTTPRTSASSTPSLVSRSAAAEAFAHAPLPAEIERLRPVLERLIARLGPEEIWLFGSRAEGRARPRSDYDLLAILPDGTPETELDPIRAWSLVRGLGVPVDIVPCTVAAPLPAFWR